MADTIKTNLGPVTAYADAKAHGYTGTREEFGVLLANAGLNLKAAETAKEGAEAAKQAAEAAQQDAAENQKNAGTQAANAKASADTAAEQAAVAKESAADASNSATAAQESETNAGQSATAAANAEAAAKQSQNAAETAKADVETAKTAAGNSADAAANSAADAKKTLESIPADYSTLSGKVNDNTSGISELKEDLSNKITKFYASNQGEKHIADSDNGKIQDMMIYGKSSQDGTPSVENPVEIKSVVNPTVKVTNEDGLKVQSVTLNNITLNAIPVSSDGNVTINGQQYVADYVDVERGKVVRKINKLILTGEENWQMGFENWGTYPYSFKAENLKEYVLSGDVMNAKYLWYQKKANQDLNSMNAPYDRCIAVSDARFSRVDEFTNELKKQNSNGTPLIVYYVTGTPQEENLSLEEIKSLKSLSTYYPVTNISANSEQLDGYTAFNYPISMANGWNYIKKQLNDNRDYIYDMDTQSAEAYVNSEYAVTLTELEV